MVFFNTWMKILCKQRPPEVLNPWTSPNVVSSHDMFCQVFTVFLNQGKDYAIIYLSCLLWSFRTFGASELVFKNVLHVMFLLPLRFFFLLNVDFYHLLGLGDRRVRSLNNEGTGNRCHVTLKLLATQSSSYF